MSALIREETNFRLSKQRLSEVIDKIKVSLQGRVEECYIFGSSSTGQIREDSDIDLILVNSESDRPFLQRAIEFVDLYEIYPKLDLLVYTKQELEDQLADSALGFWKSVRESMKRIV